MWRSGGDGGADKADGADAGTVGNPRLRFPCIADMPSLPFVSVVVKELPRWRPLVRTIPPHDLMQDLAFEYFFPAGPTS